MAAKLEDDIDTESVATTSEVPQATQTIPEAEGAVRIIVKMRKGR